MKSKKDLSKARESFKIRKLIFAFSSFSQIINCFLISGLRNTLKNDFLYILLMFLLAVCICCDRRKHHVDWAYVLIMSVLYFGFTLFSVLHSNAYWCLWIVIPEFLIFIVINLVIKTKQKKHP